MTRLTDFRQGLLNPNAPVPDGLLDGARNPAGRRYSVYRNNVTVSLIEAMQTGFPLVRKLIGPTNFDNLAQVFARDNPPKTPLMMFYGDDFPAFLDGFQPLAQIGFLSDCARLDLGIRKSYHAADAATLTAQELGAIDPERLMQQTFRLAPSTVIIQSKWPLYDIWRFNNVDGSPKPQATAQDVIITRTEYNPAPHALPVGAALWLENLTNGQPFGAAHEATLKAHPDFDLAQALTLALNTQVFEKL